MQPGNYDVSPDRGHRLDEQGIIDIIERAHIYVVIKRDGSVETLPKDVVPRAIFWRIKIRNRRRAFGL